MKQTGFPTVSKFFSKRASIDLRALAAFRVFTGFLILVDVGLRARDLRAFYTDDGVLPRSTLYEIYPTLSSASVHVLSGSATYQAALFVITAVFAVALILGYRTKIAVLFLVVLLWGVQSRNPLIITGGGLILTTLLFFALFLPLGRRMSFDSVRKGTSDESITGIRAVAPLVFVSIIIYFHNGIVRMSDELWLSGDAVYRMFGYDSFTVFLGTYIADVYPLLVAMNYAWFALLLLSPLLILLTGWRQVLLVMLFISANLGMLLTLRLGLFPVVMVAGLLLFLPTEFWDRISQYLTYPRIHTQYEEYIRKLYLGKRAPPFYNKELLRTVGSVLVGIVILIGLLWSGVALGYVDDPGDESPLSERYIFFFDPNKGISSDGWYTAPAELESGEVVDVYRDAELSHDRPPDLTAEYPTDRWHNYLLLTEGGLHSTQETVREDFAEYLCGYENRNVAEVEVYFFQQEIRSDDINKKMVVQKECT